MSCRAMMVVVSEAPVQPRACIVFKLILVRRWQHLLYLPVKNFRSFRLLVKGWNLLPGSPFGCHVSEPLPHY